MHPVELGKHRAVLDDVFVRRQEDLKRCIADVRLERATLSWVAFVAWEVKLATRQSSRIEPIFPIKLVLSRVYSAGLL